MSIGSFFRKVGRGATHFFKKTLPSASGQTSNFFTKTLPSSAKMIGRNIATGARMTANTLDKAGNIVDKIANNPMLQAGAMLLAPEYAIPALALAKEGTLLARQGANVARGVQGVANPNQYRGNATQVIGNILEKSKPVVQQASQMNFA